jgi:hypothetical protein
MEPGASTRRAAVDGLTVSALSELKFRPTPTVTTTHTHDS